MPFVCPGVSHVLAYSLLGFVRLFFIFAVLGHTLFKICLVLISFYSIYKVMGFVVTFVYVYIIIHSFHPFFSSPRPLAQTLLSLLHVTHISLFHSAVPFPLSRSLSTSSLLLFIGSRSVDDRSMDRCLDTQTNDRQTDRWMDVFCT